MPALNPARTGIAPMSAMSPALVIGMLTLLLGIQPITTDLYLPSLPGLPQQFGTSVAKAQLTLSALIIAFGVSQLACGPLADRYGRRPVLLGGMLLYTVASVLAAFAPTIEWLIAWRAAQGVAMAAAVTCARSMVRDLYEPEPGARMMSRGLGGLGFIAFASPLLGGALVHWLNWHAALLVLALYGAAALALVARRFKETVPKLNPNATRLAPLLRNWRSIARNPTFRAYTALLCASYAGLFTLLASIPFVYGNVLGVSSVGCGAILASNSLFYVAGTVLCRRLLALRGLRATIAIGGALSVGGGIATAAVSLAGAHHTSVWTLIAPTWVFMLGHGIHQPCGQSGAVGPFPDKAGTAASLSGFLTMASAFVVGQWLGAVLGTTVYPLTFGLGFFSACIAAVAWTLVQWHGEPMRKTAVAPA